MDYDMNGMNYNGFQSVSPKDKLKNIWYNYKKYIILSVCALVALIILLIVLMNPKESKLTKYSNIERIMVLNAQNYIKNNNITGNAYVSLNNLNIKIDDKYNCDTLSGVYKEDDKYTTYLICDGYNSKAITDIIEENKQVKEYAELIGSNPQIVNETTYQEEGVKDNNYQVNIKGDDIDNGLNIVTYYINDNGKNVGELKRIVIAEELEGIYPTLTLVGEKTKSIPQGIKYNDQGYKAIDGKDGNITDNVVVTGTVDENTPGTYKLTYSVTNSRGKTATETRTIVVNESENVDLDITHTLNPTTTTQKSVTITVNIKGNGYKYTILPDNSEKTSNEVTYTVYKNGTYDFIVYDKNNNSEVYSVTVKNIDTTPPKGTCTLAYEDTKVKLTIKATSNTGIAGYEILSKNNVILKTKDTEVSIDSTYEDIKARATGNNGVQATFNCEAKDGGLLKVYYLGLGRYDGHLIIGNNTTIFIDSGYESNAKRAVEFMKLIGITKLDAIVGSHLDDNHIWGQKYLVNNMEVKHAYYGDDPRTCLSRKTCNTSNSDPTTVVQALDSHNIPITVLKPGLNQKIGNLTFDIVAPINLRSGSTYVANSNSLNMILKFGSNKFYFSGDGIQEKDVLSNYDSSVLDVDVLKYPHHGQHDLSSNFINTLTPKYVILPHNSNVLKDNVKSRIKSVGGEMYVTGNSTSNNILITSDGKNLTLTRVAN